MNWRRKKRKKKQQFSHIDKINGETKTIYLLLVYEEGAHSIHVKHIINKCIRKWIDGRHQFAINEFLALSLSNSIYITFTTKYIFLFRKCVHISIWMHDVNDVAESEQQQKQ